MNEPGEFLKTRGLEDRQFGLRGDPGCHGNHLSLVAGRQSPARTSIVSCAAFFCTHPREAWVGTLGLLVLVVFQADFQLTDGFVNSLDRLDAMSAEVVGSVLEMLLGIAQRLESFADLRMLFGRHWCGRLKRCSADTGRNRLNG